MPTQYKFNIQINDLSIICKTFHFQLLTWQFVWKKILCLIFGSKSRVEWKKKKEHIQFLIINLKDDKQEATRTFLDNVYERFALESYQR